MRNVVVSIIFLLSVGTANAGVVHRLGQGIEIFDPAMSAPGNHFELDYTSILGEDQPPYTIHGITLMISAHFDVESFNIKLANDETVYSFDPNPGSPSDLAIHLYNPIFETPTGNMPFMVMPTGWINELDDGILSGQFWIDGSRQPERVVILSEASYLVPEPASITLMAFAGSLLIRTKNKRQK